MLAPAELLRSDQRPSFGRDCTWLAQHYHRFVEYNQEPASFVSRFDPSIEEDFPFGEPALLPLPAGTIAP